MRRLVGDGGTGLDDLLTWRRDHGTTATPGREERELLLLKGAGRAHADADHEGSMNGATAGP